MSHSHLAVTLFNGLGDGILARPLLAALAGCWARLDLYCLAAEAETIYGGLGLRLFPREQDDRSPPRGPRPSRWISLNAYSPIPMEAPFEAAWPGVPRRSFPGQIQAGGDPRWQQGPMRDQYFVVAGLTSKARPSDAPPPASPEAAQSARGWLRDSGAGPVCVLHGDSLPEKMWPAGSWSLLAGRLQRFRLRLVACGKERGLWAGVPWVSVAWPDLDLAGQLAILRGADLFIGIDSLFLHAADAFERPGVILWGPSDLAVWGPYSDRLRVLASPDGSMSSLTIDTVLAAVEGLLGAENLISPGRIQSGRTHDPGSQHQPQRRLLPG